MKHRYAPLASILNSSCSSGSNGSMKHAASWRRSSWLRSKHPAGRNTTVHTQWRVQVHVGISSCWRKWSQLQNPASHESEAWKISRKLKTCRTATHRSQWHTDQDDSWWKYYLSDQSDHQGIDYTLTIQDMHKNKQSHMSLKVAMLSNKGNWLSVGIILKWPQGHWLLKAKKT